MSVAQIVFDMGGALQARHAGDVESFGEVLFLACGQPSKLTAFIPASLRAERGGSLTAEDVEAVEEAFSTAKNDNRVFERKNSSFQSQDVERFNHWLGAKGLPQLDTPSSGGKVPLQTMAELLEEKGYKVMYSRR